MTDGRGRRNCLTPSAVSDTSHRTSTATNTASAGASSPSFDPTPPSRGARPTPAMPGRETAPLVTRVPQPGTRSAAATPSAADPASGVVRIGLAQRLADQRHELEIVRQLPRLDGPRLGQVDVDDARNPAGPGRHDDHSRRQEDRLGDGVGHEDDRRPEPPPEVHQLEVHPFAGHLVERPERLVHEEQARVEGEGPGDRDALLHPARQLPRVLGREVTELDEIEQCVGALHAFRAGEAHDLERQLDVALHGPPVHQHRRLEDHAVVALEAGPCGRLAVHQHLAGARLGQVTDQPQQRGLAAAGRTDQRDELARLEGQVDPLQRRHRRRTGAERLAHPADLDHGPAVRSDRSALRARDAAHSSAGR